VEGTVEGEVENIGKTGNAKMLYVNKKLKTGVIISSGSGLNNSGNGQSKQSKKSKNKKQQQPQHCWCCRADQTYTLEKGIMLNKNMILFQLQVMVKRIG